MPVVTETKASTGRGSATDSPVARIGWMLPPLVLVLFALRPLAPIKDPDAYWHIVAGEHLVQTGLFVLDDPFGAATEKVWILNQWLPEVLMHWAHTAYGLPGVAWLLCLGSFLTGLAVYAACRRRASALVTALVVTIVFVALSGSLSPRPQLVTFALTAVTTSTWLLTREDGRARWWLVPMSWLWACSHGMWFMGPVVGFVVVVGMLLERRASVAQAVRLAMVPFLSVAVAAVTPVGPRLFMSPLQVGGVTAYISEWQKPGLGDPAVLAALALAGAAAIGHLRQRRRSWTVLFLVLLGLLLALTWSRTVGLGAVILAPMAAKGIQSLMCQPLPPVAPRERRAVAVAGIASLILVVVVAPKVATTPAIGPNGLDDALSRLPAGTVLCNDQADGGWLMMRHPDLRSTMDTRVELYTVEHIRSYLDFMAARPGWLAYVQRVKCSYAVLPAASAVARPLSEAAGWKVIAQGGGYVLFAS